MALVKRVVRPEPALIVTDDGYRYEWAEGGEAVDVLEHHRRSVLAVKGAHLVEVELIDQPVVLPAFVTGKPVALATEAPTGRKPDPDLSDAYIDPATAREPTPEPEDPATIPPAPRPADVPAAVNVTDLWSDADLALLDRTR